jgi:hypothetical protein
MWNKGLRAGMVPAIHRKLASQNWHRAAGYHLAIFLTATQTAATSAPMTATITAKVIKSTSCHWGAASRRSCDGS